MKTEILKIEQIEIESGLYPRKEYDESTAKRYAEMLNSGVKFPLIKVAKLKDKYILVDGKHRIEANKINGEDFIQAEVLENLSEKEIFIEAVNSNIGHGKPFSEDDLDSIKITLEEFELSIEKISEIMRVPVDNLKPVVAEQIESFYDEEFANKKEYVFDRKPIDPNKLPTPRAEIERRKKEEEFNNRYTIENFMCFLFAYSKRIEDFLKNIPESELNKKDFKEEANLFLEKFSRLKKYLKRIELVLKEVLNKDISKWKEVKKYSRKETNQQRIQRLLKEEDDYLSEENDKDNDL